MKNNLTTTQNTDLILKKSKSMLTITNRILSGKTALTQKIDEIKITIQDIADEAGLSNTYLSNKANELGFNLQTPSSTLNVESAGILVEYLISGNLPKDWKQNNEIEIDESWIERLWAWADENELSKDELPRDKKSLLELTKLSLDSRKLRSLPKEIGNLSNLTYLFLGNNQLTGLPKEIGKLFNLRWLDLHNNSNLILSIEQKNWIRYLENNDCIVY